MLRQFIKHVIFFSKIFGTMIKVRLNLKLLQMPPLHDAVQRGNESDVRSLLQNPNININSKDKNGNTPLLLAGCIRDESIYNSIVKILIENGADVNACNKEFSPLYHAVFYQRETAVQMLLEEGASIKQPKNLLHIVARNGAKGVLRLLLADNRCTEDVINELDDVGRTAAYIAAQEEHKDCLKMLIAKGADLSRTLLGDETVMDVIFERITSPIEFLLEILNSMIYMVQIEGQRNRYFIGESNFCYIRVYLRF